jgi:hypothetical protein
VVWVQEVLAVAVVVAVVLEVLETHKTVVPGLMRIRLGQQQLERGLVDFIQLVGEAIPVQIQVGVILVMVLPTLVSAAVTTTLPLMLVAPA